MTGGNRKELSAEFGQLTVFPRVKGKKKNPKGRDSI